jgi:hypothetical protein
MEQIERGEEEVGAVSPPSLNFLLLGNPNVFSFLLAVENLNNFHYTGTQYCAPSCGARRVRGDRAVHPQRRRHCTVN